MRCTISSIGHHPLAVGVTAAARRLLIVDLDRSRTGALIIHHRAAQIAEAAEAGIGVDNQRQGGAAPDDRDAVDEFALGGEAHVREAERRVQPVAGQIKRLEPGLLRGERGDPVIDAGDVEKALRAPAVRGVWPGLFGELASRLKSGLPAPVAGTV